MLAAEAPERFTTRFLESLEFKSTNDRLFINVLKDLGFLDTDGVPKDRYYQFLDRSQSAAVVADGVREAFSDLFAVNKNAEALTNGEVRNKLRTLYKGSKKDNLINRIASTFAALCEYADFSKGAAVTQKAGQPSSKPTDTDTALATREPIVQSLDTAQGKQLTLGALQYHINIMLPESRDAAVYDAIFKSLRDHLGK